MKYVLYEYKRDINILRWCVEYFGNGIESIGAYELRGRVFRVRNDPYSGRVPYFVEILFRDLDDAIVCGLKFGLEIHELN